MQHTLLYLLLGLFATATVSAQSLSRSHTLNVSPAEAPYLVSLSVPSGSDIRNISEAGRYDADTSTVLWGPFMDMDSRVLEFDLISETAATLPTAAQIIYSTTTENTTAATAAAAERTYLSWIKSTGLLSLSKTARSVSIDLDGNGIPNAIEYLLDLSPIEGGAIWDKLTLSENGTDRTITFPSSINSSEFRLLVDVLDLSNGGSVTETIEPALQSQPYTISSQGDQFIFRLRTEVK